MFDSRRQRGIALITVLLLVALTSALLAAAFVSSAFERDVQASSMAATRGFYAAEAGLNLRAAAIRREFDGYRRPAGSSPTIAPGLLPCEPGAPTSVSGDGDFACGHVALDPRDVRTWVVESPGNPGTVRIAPGELYQNLYAQEYRYTVGSVSVGRRGRPEALLEMEFKSRLIPLFQFAVFYNKDLEILPGPPMELAGPVHANGDLYLGAIERLTIGGQVTTTDRLFHGRKDDDECQGGDVAVYDPASPTLVPACDDERRELHAADLAGWNGMIRTAVEPLVVPEPQSRDARPGRLYWDRADLRIVLDLNGASPELQVRRQDGTVDLAESGRLATCGAVGSSSGALFNKRENAAIDLLEIDVAALIDCVDASPSLQGGRALDDATDGGLVWHLSVDGPRSGDARSAYGVRLDDGDELRSSRAGAPAIRGLTIVSDQALYVKGNFNAGDWRPAALMADTLNVLSDAWDDGASRGPLSARVASPTTIRAAFLAGTDSTAGTEGVGGQDRGRYNGGVENYPRFHESWRGVRLTYQGSFVSLGTPRHAVGSWDAQEYDPPIRDWSFESRFSDAAKLPPLSPRAVFLHQELFERDFEL